MSDNASKYGLTGWDDVELSNGKNMKRNRDEFIRLDSGSNVVRIVTKPHQYLVHKYKEKGDLGFGDKIMCSAFHGSCPVCELGDRPKRRWFVGVIDRKAQAYKVLDMSPAIFKSVQEFNRDEDYGEPTGYDMDIKVDKNGGATGYYTVIPKPPKPLSPEDMEIRNNADLDDLKRRCSPPTSDQTSQRLAAIRARKVARLQAAGVTDDNSTSDDPFPAVN